MQRNVYNHCIYEKKDGVIFYNVHVVQNVGVKLLFMCSI